MAQNYKWIFSRGGVYNFAIFLHRSEEVSEENQPITEERTMMSVSVKVFSRQEISQTEVLMLLYNHKK